MLENIGGLQATAEAAKKTALEASRSGASATKDYERKLNSLKLKIATGSYTTGDHLLDINIVDNDSVHQDERYAAMVELEKRLELYGGKLVAQIYRPLTTYQVRKMGLLPSNPKLQLRVGAAYGKGRVFGGDASVRIVLPVLNQDGNVFELLDPCWDGPLGKLTFGSNIVLEDSLQEMLDRESYIDIAVGLWSNAQFLGRRLAASEIVMGEIVIRREQCALELQKLIAKLRSETKDLQKAQQNPSSWVPRQITIEDDHAIVSFESEIREIKQARRNLVLKVRAAALLGMHNEPVSAIYREAEELLEATKMWDI